MTIATPAKLDRGYLELLRHFPLRPIRSKRELDRAMKIAGHLATYDEGTLPVGEQDYLDTLTILIEEFQKSASAEMPEVSPLAMLKHLMEERGMTVTDLGRVVGSQSNASLILSGKRGLSKRVIGRLAEHFHVAPGVFF
jgi:HTH-type transcriptional regulator/antitoxin HigA